MRVADPMLPRLRVRCAPCLAARRRQRGAAAVFAGLAMVALLASVALVIDIGNLYFAQRDLQNKANLAALDTARMASGCYGEAVPPMQAAQDALQRNGAPAEWLVNAEVGVLERTPDGLRRFSAGDDPYNFATEVSLSRSAPRRILGGGDVDGSRLLRASAAATAVSEVDLSVGSFAALFNPTQPGALLAGLLPDIQVDVLSFNALLEAQVDLADFTEEGLVTELSEFLTEEILLPDFLDALGAILTGAGESAAAALVQAIDAGSMMAETFVPAELFNVEDNLSPLLSGTAVSAGDLLTTAIQNVLVDGVLELIIQLGGGREVSVLLREAPQLGTGPPGLQPGGEELTEARTAQVRLIAGLPLVDLLPSVGSLNFVVDAASARAAVTGVRCPRAGQPDTEVRIRTRGSVTTIGLDPVSVPLRLSDVTSALGLSDGALLQLVGGSGNLLCGVLGGLPGLGGALCSVLTNDPLLQLDITMPHIEVPGPPDQQRWVSPPFPQTFRVQSSPSEPLKGLILDELDVRLQVAGTSVPTGVLADLIAALNPLLEAALIDALGPGLDGLLEPILAELGVSLAGADVTVSAVRIERPRLFSTVER